MLGIEVVAFAAALVDAIAKSYRLVERYKDAEPRAKQLLDEIKVTSDLIAHLQLQLSNPVAICAIDPTLLNSLSTWISRCQETQHEIEIRLSSTSSAGLSRRKRIKIAASDDVFATLEQRVNRDRISLNSLLQSLHWESRIRSDVVLARLEHQAASTVTSLDKLQHQSEGLLSTTQLGFNDTHSMLAQMMYQINLLSLQVLRLRPALTGAVPSEVPRDSQHLLKVVQLAKHQYLDRGTLKTYFTSMECPNLHTLSAGQRAEAARKLIFIRVLVWLLEQPLVHSYAWGSYTSVTESKFTQQARLDHVWHLSSSLTVLETLLLDRASTQVLREFLDLQDRRWRRYLLRRLGQRNPSLVVEASYAEVVRSLYLRSFMVQWLLDPNRDPHAMTYLWIKRQSARAHPSQRHNSGSTGQLTMLDDICFGHDKAPILITSTCTE